MTLAHTDVVTAARNLMERIDPATAGLWPRATALLARQALESALDDFWKVRAPGMEQCSMRAQLLCLPYFLQASKPPGPQALGNEHLAERVSYAWAGLSRACHQHPYELPPTCRAVAPCAKADIGGASRMAGDGRRVGCSREARRELVAPGSASRALQRDEPPIVIR